MVNRFKKQLGQSDENFQWWWLLVVPIAGAALVSIFRRMRRLNEAYPYGPRSGMVPMTGQPVASPSTTDLERTSFGEVTKDHVVPEMADFETRHPQTQVVESRPAEIPQASEDSGVDVSGEHSLGHMHPSEQEHASEPYTATQPQADEAEGQIDDFRIIEGIGPSLSALLHRAGINTFTQLANASQDQLNAILEAAGIRQITDPGAWPEQAALCAQGKWDELVELQRTLRRGLRMS